MPDYFHFSRDTQTRIKFNCLLKTIKDAEIYLQESNYSFDYGRNCIFTIMLFGEWLQRKKIAVAKVTRLHIDQYLDHCEKETGRYCEARRAGVRIALKLIQKRYPRKKSTIEREIEQFSLHLSQNQGLRDSSIHIHSCNIENFLNSFFKNKKISIASLKPLDIHEYMKKIPPTDTNRRKMSMRSSLSRYFMYIQMKGTATKHLTNALPRIVSKKKNRKPKIASKQEINALLKSIDQFHPTGLRTYASILCMSELGIRISDVVSMSIDDIDWEKGVITIRNSKMGVPYQLPLSKKVGEAIKKYITKGRPLSKYRHVFLCHRPHELGTPATAMALKCQLRLAWIKAGLYDKCSGTHIFRRTLATNLHRKQIPLKTIADVLGHSAIQSTLSYIQPDIQTLKSAAQEWPEENAHEKNDD